jgi:hypothetical protein
MNQGQCPSQLLWRKIRTCFHLDFAEMHWSRPRASGSRGNDAPWSDATQRQSARLGPIPAMPPFARNLIDRCNVVSPNRQLETGLGVIPRRFTLPMKKNLLLAAVCLTATAFAQKFENLALTPPMGWNSWNTFAANIDEDLIKGTADTMIANGMRDAGYVYLVVDDCWEAKERDADGNIVPDPVKFPHGMKALGDYLHAKGFKFGIHNCAGTETCAGFPGGRGHEYQDALRYAAWGVDFLKYDWCMHGTADSR